ncbi:GHMP family kinase ATP-binding protein [Spiroplasma cantharicola]|uniref:4-diphosphocytidyl-2-C-methyl-D-erythritol kinase n=1 Tax=Spiroplasma cantharicola TaxID=362837 RepID=A0A0M4JT93_9MOLU|nr:hypothetical protein [Spiroplasma cantharicola]ALD66910.1 4-diphosphocytidyl-2-C-methyl-D-erythritol kinase [Spiroplasma cantharicola]
MLIKSYAKVNLNLKVSKKKKNLHKINSIFTIVPDLYDEIEIVESNETQDLITCNFKELEKKNFIYTVLNYLRDKKIITSYYNIKIFKNIPIGSGLGGGSSNAIAVAKYFTNNIKILKKISKTIGTDCYFFIWNFSTARVKSYGNKVKKIPDKIQIKFEDLIFTKVKCDTKKVYEKFDEIKGWKNKCEKNMLEIPALELYPTLIKYKELGQLSGSGSTFIKKTSLLK